MAVKTFSAWYCRFPFYNSFFFGRSCSILHRDGRTCFSAQFLCQALLWKRTVWQALLWLAVFLSVFRKTSSSIVPQPIFRCGFKNLTQTLGSMNWLSTTVNCTIMWCNLIQCWAEGDIAIIQLADQNFFSPSFASCGQIDDEVEASAAATSSACVY